MLPPKRPAHHCRAGRRGWPFGYFGPIALDVAEGISHSRSARLRLSGSSTAEESASRPRQRVPQRTAIEAPDGAGRPDQGPYAGRRRKWRVGWSTRPSARPRLPPGPMKVGFRLEDPPKPGRRGAAEACPWRRRRRPHRTPWCGGGHDRRLARRLRCGHFWPGTGGRRRWGVWLRVHRARPEAGDLVRRDMQ